MVKLNWCKEDYTLAQCGENGWLTGVWQNFKKLNEFTTADEALAFCREHAEVKEFHCHIWFEDVDGSLLDLGPTRDLTQMDSLDMF